MSARAKKQEDEEVARIVVAVDRFDAEAAWWKMQGRAAGWAQAVEWLREQSGKLYAKGKDEKAEQCRVLAQMMEEPMKAAHKVADEYMEATVDPLRQKYPYEDA